MSDETPDTPTTKSRLPWILGALAVIVAALGAGAVVWLLDTPAKKPVAKKSFDACRQGKVVKANASQLVLKRANGSTETFVVRDEYLIDLDIPHMKQHAAVGQLTLVYSYKDGSDLVAIDQDDAPLNIEDSPPCKV